jgi:hypothetical protein
MLIVARREAFPARPIAGRGRIEAEVLSEPGDLGLVDVHDGRPSRQSRDFRCERPRRRHAEMSNQRGSVCPMLQEDDLQGVLDVLVDRVKETAGLGARATDVLEALGQNGIEIV